MYEQPGGAPQRQHRHRKSAPFCGVAVVERDVLAHCPIVVEARAQGTGTGEGASVAVRRFGSQRVLFRGAWLQNPDLDFADPWISLVTADLTGLPPTAVHYGEFETLADDGIAFGRRLAEFDVVSEVHPMPEGQHSFILGA